MTATVSGPDAGARLTDSYLSEMGRLAYLWGWPLVNMHNRLSIMEQVPEPGLLGGVVPVGPPGSLGLLHDYITPDEKLVACPNQDVVYGFGILSMEKEPVVVQVPDFGDRFWVFQVCDQRTDGFAELGKMYGTKPGMYLLAGPDWKGETPPGIQKVFRSTTQFSLAGFRTQLINPGDIENVHKIQAAYKAETLSAFLHQPAPPPAAAVTFPKIDKDLVKTNFFQYLDFALQFAPPGPEEMAIRSKLARIGIGAGKTFDFKELSVEHKAEVLLGMKSGDGKVDEAVKNVGKKLNGWNVASIDGDRAFFNGNWLLRAAAAKAGIYGNDAVEAVYPLTTVDGAGATLDGSKHKYTLTFAAGQFPPVNAFWSVTMYDGKTQLLVANPLKRYLLNSTTLNSYKYGPDGSLTFYIQKNSPGKERESNWLPAPDGPLYAVYRVYMPGEAVLNGTWKKPQMQAVAAK